MTATSVPAETRIAIAVAFDEDRGIGRHGTLAWHHAADLRRFRAQTMGLTVIVGRLTLLSLPGPLKGRKLIVVGREPTNGLHGSAQARDLSEALHLAGQGRHIVAGGAQLYADALPIADEILLTRIPGRHGCDRHFPAFEGEDWHLDAAEEAGDGLRFETWLRA